MANQISPQGYQINKEPINNNPFWEEQPAPGSLLVTEIDVSKQTVGNYTTYTWSYLDQLGERHFLAEQRVASNAGDDGVTFTPSVSAEGVISWTNNGGLPNPAPVNIKGLQGIQGPQGIQGEPGIQGPRGLTGPQGIQGIPGPQGVQGVPGAQGLPGQNGVTFIPSVDANGNISWTNNGEMENPETVNIKGPAGPQGEQGLPGPQGLPGDVGAMPDISATAVIGSATGTPSVSVNVTGTAEEPVINFNFQNLKGEQGEQGIPGQDGMGTVAVGTTTTGEPGTDASVTNSGTAQNAILNFTIPRGATGETGATGATGPQGPAGADGEDGVGVPAGGTAGQVLKKASGTDYDTEWGTASGVPAGGSANQVLAKKSVTDGDTKWMSITQNKFPSGGTSGQILIKNSNTNYDASWMTKYFVPSGGTAGQVLAKSSGTDGAVGWVTPSGTGNLKATRVINSASLITTTTSAAASLSYTGTDLGVVPGKTRGFVVELVASFRSTFKRSIFVPLTTNFGTGEYSLNIPISLGNTTAYYIGSTSYKYASAELKFSVDVQGFNPSYLASNLLYIYYKSSPNDYTAAGFYGTSKTGMAFVNANVTDFKTSSGGSTNVCTVTANVYRIDMES